MRFGFTSAERTWLKHMHVDTRSYKPFSSVLTILMATQMYKHKMTTQIYRAMLSEIQVRCIWYLWLFYHLHKLKLFLLNVVWSLLPIHSLFERENWNTHSFFFLIHVCANCQYERSVLLLIYMYHAYIKPMSNEWTEGVVNVPNGLQFQTNKMLLADQLMILKKFGSVWPSHWEKEGACIPDLPFKRLFPLLWNNFWFK